MKIGCIIQARTTSTRLPNKVLLNLPYNCEITVLEQVVRRVQKSKFINKIIIATTTNNTDDPIVELAKKIGVSFYRGSENNVLSRYYESGVENNFDVIVRITSDCPCIDYEIIDKIIEAHLNNNNDYTSNVIVRSYAHGLDTEVFNMSALKEAFLNATEKYEIEHVTPYIYKTHQEKFKIEDIIDNQNNSNIRITLDSKADYCLLCTIYDYLYYENEDFLSKDIIKFFNEKPWFKDINKEVEQKKVCKNLSEELDESIQLLKNRDLNKAASFIMCKRDEQKLKFKRVTFENCSLLFQWANDESVRANSFNQETIEYESHKLWLKNQLEDVNVYMYIAYWDNNAVGQIRIDIDQNLKRGLIGFSVDKNYRGLGYGHKMLLDIVHVLKEESVDITKLVGRVKISNIVSQKSFIKAGYTQDDFKEYKEYTKLL